MGNYGLDVGTSFIVLANEGTEEGTTEYKEFRDAFYVIKPSTPIAKKMIEKGLKGKTFIKDEDNGTFIVLGSDAIEKAVERNSSANRPMHRGVISPKEKDARKVLSYILQEVAGKAKKKGDKLVFCVPAQPVDQKEDEFDVSYHEDVVTNILSGLGYDAKAIYEAEALCYSELEDDDYTGISCSAGAGMINICVMLNGEPVLNFSLARGGDFIDRMAAIACGESDSVVQVEKEGGEFTIGEENDNQVLAAVSAYYERLIEYIVKQLSAHLDEHKSLPKFTNALPIVLAGGTSQAKGFVETFKKYLDENDFPLEISEVRHAKDPLHSVARGCLVACEVF